MKTVFFLGLLVAGTLVACGDDTSTNATRRAAVGTPLLVASNPSPTTAETVTFSVAVSGGALPEGIIVWSDDCKGEFYSQAGTQATWQNKWAEACVIKAEIFSPLVTAPTAVTRVTLSTKYDKGTVLTVAGTSCRQRETWDENNPMVDEGLNATNASFGRLGGIAISKKGEIFFTDRTGGRVLKVDTEGKLRRVAGLAGGNYSNDNGDGGLALNARLYWPYGVALDSKENIYVSSAWGNRIRKIETATGLISTYAGNGNCCSAPTHGAKATETTLSNPLYLEFDPQDNLFLTTRDLGLYKVYANSGTIATLPGDYNYSFGLAWTPSGIYVANRYDYNVVRFTETLWDTELVAGNGNEGYAGDGTDAINAELNQPYAVEVGKDGTVYIADTYNAVIRAVLTNGKIRTVVGPGLNTLPGDGGQILGHSIANPSDIEIDTNGDMYIADRLSCQIKKVVGPF